jgi:beta-aspartyl-peptidase (threonine type)
LLVGEGAEQFAVEKDLETVESSYFRTELRHNNWLKARQALKTSARRRIDIRPSETDEMIGTVGCVALDQNGNLAAATSTGGVAHKRFGRMGDSSIIGAGNYADNRTCAVSCTGVGEHFIRNAVAFQVHALMRYKDWPLEKAVRHVIDEELKDGTGGLIAIDRRGTIFMHFNREGMRRAAANSTGRFDVEYWE